MITALTIKKINKTYGGFYKIGENEGKASTEKLS
jgi:hypothetical protein